jgi:hypothetical protein
MGKFLSCEGILMYLQFYTVCMYHVYDTSLIIPSVYPMLLLH